MSQPTPPAPVSPAELESACKMAGCDGPYVRRVLDRVALRLRWLERELERFGEGMLTADELHNLCHNLHLRGTPISEGEFRAGCERFTAQLFHDRPPENLANCPAAALSQLQAEHCRLLQLIEQVVCVSCQDNLTDALAEEVPHAVEALPDPRLQASEPDRPRLG